MHLKTSLFTSVLLVSLSLGLGACGSNKKAKQKLEALRKEVNAVCDCGKGLDAIKKTKGADGVVSFNKKQGGKVASKVLKCMYRAQKDAVTLPAGISDELRAEEKKLRAQAAACTKRARAYAK